MPGPYFDAAYGASEIATLIGRDDFLSQIGLDTRIVEGLQDLREEIRTGDCSRECERGP